MKLLAATLLMLLVIDSADALQRRRTPPRRPPARSEPATARIIGSPVVIITKSGDRIAGQVLDITAFGIKIKTNGLESQIPLETIASLSFGSAGVETVAPLQRMNPLFSRDFNVVNSSFQAIAGKTREGIDYTEYGRMVSEMRRTAERFIERHSVSENASESRVVALVSGALTDYSWARTVWSLKLGRTGEAMVGETDNPTVADTLALYPDVRDQARSGSRYSVDRLVAGLWQKGADKIGRAREIVAQALESGN